MLEAYNSKAMSFDPVESDTDSVFSDLNLPLRNLRQPGAADLFDPIESDTDSLFGNGYMSDQEILHPYASHDSVREQPADRLSAEPSLFVENEPDDFIVRHSNSFDQPGSQSEDSLEKSEGLRSGTRLNETTQVPQPTDSNGDSENDNPLDTTIQDSEDGFVSDSTFEGFYDDDIPAEAYNDDPARSCEYKVDEALGAFASQEDLETLKCSNLSVELPQSSLLIPKSHYEPFYPGAPELSEREAVSELMEVLEASGESSDQDFLELNLNEFAIYNEVKAYGVEMRALTDMETKFHGGRFVFDGVLSTPGSDKKYFVRGVPIQALPIGNYTALGEHTVRDDIWVLSPLNSRRGLYYKLCRPANEYRRFHEPFLWVADLAKHFVDFMSDRWEEGHRVSVHDFRADFKEWLIKHHGHAPVFCEWLSKYPRSDFRASIIANLPFLHKEAIGVLGEKQTYVHTLWKEAWSFTQYLPLKEEESTEESSDKLSEDVTEESNDDVKEESTGVPKKKKISDGGIPQTVVTPYIKSCFEKLPFGDLLQATEMSSRTTALRNKAIRYRHLEKPHAVDKEKADLSTTTKSRIKDIRPGDTLSTGRDIDGHWERQETRTSNDVDRWFVLVQAVHVNKKGERSFDVIWYYQPVDTICGIMAYPWGNELFLSDHCNCEEETKISEREVLGIHDVDFHGTGTTNKEVFCRQTYLSEDRKFVTLEAKHLKCAHYRASHDWERARYQPGETVLAHLDRKTQISEPCEVVSSYKVEARGMFTYKLRRFLRRHLVDPASAAPPNELVYTDDIVTVSEKLIKDRCFIRQFRASEAIPCPYDRRGTGGFFYMTHEHVTSWDGTRRAVPLKTFKKSFKQGYDPNEKIPKLRGLDLFCGGGNLGRGLEDGGGIQMKWANDYVDKAIHTYMANADPEQVHPFLGSIDIMQRLAIEGKFSKSVPKPGDVEFISGGSPCPGFSRLTNDKETRQQRKNQSLVAAFASMVDLYRPKYGLLENVPGIVQKKASRDQDVLCQLICALVGLGYQTSFYLMDANSCGAPQRRSRVFLVFAAPGCELPPKPIESHSQPPGTPSSSLGRLPNDLPMAERTIPEATPFKYITAAEATADLPRIQDGKPDICISQPDHRVTFGQTLKIRKEQAYIPMRPYGMNFAKAWFGEDLKAPGSGVLTPSERSCYPADNPGATISRVARNSQAYGRCYPNAFIGTITTRLSANDAKDGRCLHWAENRPMTLMEARRAQGFRDEDVLLGSTGDQFKIVGNSVAREISVALGAAFREAWFATLQKRPRETGPASAERVRRVAETRQATGSFVDLTRDNAANAAPFSSSSSSFTPNLKKTAPTSSSSSGFPNLNGDGNGKRGASAHEETYPHKAQRRSSSSLTLTQESSRSGNAEMTRTTMTFTTVNEVEQWDGEEPGVRNSEFIVIDD